MKRLSTLINDANIEALKSAIARNVFPGIDFPTAMKFLLSDGILPVDDLPLPSFLQLEDWIHANHAPPPVIFTATELKNKLGTVIDSALRGHVVNIYRHNRLILEIRRLNDN